MIRVMKYKSTYLAVAGILFTASVGALVLFGLKLGLDFTGGTLIEVSFAKERPAVDEMQAALAPLALGTIVVQPTGDRNMLVRTRYVSEEEHQKILETLRAGFEEEANAPVTLTLGGGEIVEGVAFGTKTAPEVIEERIETIGPTISAELRRRAFGAGVATVLITLLYIGYAFRGVSRVVASWKYGLSAITAMMYNIIVIMGLFAVLGRVKGVEVDIPFVVALLTVFGYSINDTIVVFDRVRENLIRYRGEAFSSLVDRGINETIGRSLTTGCSTLLVLFALYLFGGATIHYFALALIIGIIFGTSSSIFVASAILVAWEEYRQKKLATV
jgi:preprotein translocase subunit SecF